MTDTERLIEEAGETAKRMAKIAAPDEWVRCNCSASPAGHTTRKHDFRKIHVDTAHDAATRLNALATALRAEREQGKATTISLRCAEAALKEATAIVEPLKSANLAANKRIVELEHERDAARAELARLTTPRPIAEAPKDERSRILARGRDGQWREMRLVRGEWRWFGAGNEHIESPTEYLPLPVLP